jgi:hypothetical protein
MILFNQDKLAIVNPLFVQRRVTWAPAYCNFPFSGIEGLNQSPHSSVIRANQLVMPYWKLKLQLQNIDCQRARHNKEPLNFITLIQNTAKYWSNISDVIYTAPCRVAHLCHGYTEIQPFGGKLDKFSHFEPNWADIPGVNAWRRSSLWLPSGIQAVTTDHR